MYPDELNSLKGKSNEETNLFQMKDDLQIFFHKLLIAISFDLKVQNEAIKIITNELNQINANATQVFESLKLITKK